MMSSKTIPIGKHWFNSCMPRAPSSMTTDFFNCTLQQRDAGYETKHGWPLATDSAALWCPCDTWRARTHQEVFYDLQESRDCRQPLAPGMRKVLHSHSSATGMLGYLTLE